ncbi:hypothetical protein QL285_021225 [Trifolium repens]|nr:hypothetical protein QL285_021225 [Trifolium repens]
MNEALTLYKEEFVCEYLELIEMDIEANYDSCQIIDSEPIATFPVIRLSYQNFTEVAPWFVEEYYNDLIGDWMILSEHGAQHLLKFNSHKIFPLLTDGWNTFARFYHLPGNVCIIFSYHGSKCFGVKSIERITSCDEILPFHSRDIHGPNVALFEIQMTPENIKKKTLDHQALGSSSSS